MINTAIILTNVVTDKWRASEYRPNSTILTIEDAACHLEIATNWVDTFNSSQVADRFVLTMSNKRYCGNAGDYELEVVDSKTLNTNKLCEMTAHEVNVHFKKKFSEFANDQALLALSR